VAPAEEIPHSIRILPAPSDEPLTEFNCVMHALGLIGRIDDPSGKPPFNGWYADTNFLRWLIARGLLGPCEPAAGAIVTWSAGSVLRHVGVVVAPNRAISKWGVGHLWEHGLLEVPASYGDDLAFYHPIDPESALRHLKSVLLQCLARRCAGWTPAEWIAYARAEGRREPRTRAVVGLPTKIPSSPTRATTSSKRGAAGHSATTAASSTSRCSRRSARTQNLAPSAHGCAAASAVFASARIEVRYAGRWGDGR
jgi:hypothetical protein